MNTAKTIDLTRLCIQSHTRQTYNEMQNKKHVNSKPKEQSNTMFRISRFRTTDIHRRTERLGQ